jgi:2-polyprenyl-3-methyl-5-hydroxy-6-metoxy-1,4-benzoquinol methylase
MPIRNPDATNDLVFNVLVLCNTPDEALTSNILYNAARDLPWAAFEPKHDDIIVLCGGGPSLADHLDDVYDMQKAGATVWAMNGASKFLRDHGIEPDAQVIADAKPETVELYDPECRLHYIASQCDRQMFDQGGEVVLWHLAMSEDMDKWFPKKRRDAGGYALVGGGAAVGNSALCLSYVLGYRAMHLYGYDSSHRDNASHAYEQEMNQFIPTADVEWAGKTYRSSVAMKAQAEKFQITGQALQAEGCRIYVHGDGLLPAMWNTDASDMTMRDKYRLMWLTDAYRAGSPGEQLISIILYALEPDSMVIDFGCGTGRASLELVKKGIPVFLIDFADNCRDEEAIELPFLEWDLRQPIPPSAEYGICCDVMEHIPEEDVETVISNIMQSATNVFFSISTIHDALGVMINDDLHVTVKPHDWWLDVLQKEGTITWEQQRGETSLFVVKRTIQ